MSQANVEIVRRCFEAFTDGELYEGHEGVRRGMGRWLGTWTDYAMEVDEYIDAGDSVVIFFRESGRGKGSGVWIEQSVAGVWTLHDGQVVRVMPFLDRSEAVEAAGLSE